MPSRNVNLTKKKRRLRSLSRFSACAAPALSGSMSCSTGEWTVMTTLSSCQSLKSMKTAAEPNSSRWVRPSRGHLVAQALAHQDPGHLLDARVDVHPPAMMPNGNRSGVAARRERRDQVPAHRRPAARGRRARRRLWRGWLRRHQPPRRPAAASRSGRPERAAATDRRDDRLDVRARSRSTSRSATP